MARGVVGACLGLVAVLAVYTLLWPSGAEAASLGADGRVGVVFEDNLIEAARAGDVLAVRELLASGVNPDGASGDGMTALHWAAERNQPAVAAVLLEAGATVDSRTRIGGYTPLHLASRRGNIEMVLALLDAGAAVHASTTNSGVTALHFAAAAVQGAASVKALLERGADPNVVEATFGQTPLMFASGANGAESIRALLAAGADPSVETKVVDVLQHVIADDEASRVLNDALDGMRKADGGGPDWEPSAAQVREAVETQRAYLASGEAYRQYDSDELIRLRPDYPGGPDIARRPYRETLVGFTGGMTALLHAAREGHIEAAMALLDGGADIDQPSADNTSPLLIATLNGQFDLALRLIERGADPDIAASTDGATPLFAALNTHWAPKSNYPQPRAQDKQRAEHLEVLEALLAAGADPNPRLNTHLWYWEYGLTKIGTDLRGATPFWRAAYAQDVEAMKLLVAHGADPNVPTVWPEPGMRERRQQDGRQQEDSGLPTIPTDAFNAYPVHVAAGGGYTGLGAFSIRNVPNAFIPAVKYLVEELGADVNLRDSWGYTPLHYAAARGDNDLIRYLISQGADVTVISRLGQSTADLARGGRSGFFTRVAYPETVELLRGLGSTLECLHTHFLDTGDSCPLAGVDDPWAPRTEEEEDGTTDSRSEAARRESSGEDLIGR